MRCTSVVGLQWGDEAKGKIVDLLTEEHDLVVRYNGGANAGHTVVFGGKTYKLSLLPMGVLRPHILSVITNGVVVDPTKFRDELRSLSESGVHLDPSRLVVSRNSHVIFPHHREEERCREAAAGKSAIGTTMRGIGPCYMDKLGRTNAIRVHELLEPAHLRDRLTEVVAYKKAHLGGQPHDPSSFDVDRILSDLQESISILRPHVTDTFHLLHRSLKQGKRLLFEAAQGSLLDVDHGTYPFVTSSNSSVAGIWSGSGVPARYLQRVVGVIKAYSTRVGGGPFPTELTDSTGEHIRKVGREYGTVTGRPRRCGWFDAVATRYSATLNGADELALMLLDVLSQLDEVKIATSYLLDGEPITEFPADARTLERCQPIFETLPGWKSDIQGIRKVQDLPSGARRYVDRIAELLAIPVRIISVGPDRTQTLFVHS